MTEGSRQHRGGEHTQSAVSIGARFCHGAGARCVTSLIMISVNFVSGMGNVNRNATCNGQKSEHNSYKYISRDTETSPAVPSPPSQQYVKAIRKCKMRKSIFQIVPLHSSLACRNCRPFIHSKSWVFGVHPRRNSKEIYPVRSMVISMLPSSSRHALSHFQTTSNTTYIHGHIAHRA